MRGARLAAAVLLVAGCQTAARPEAAPAPPPVAAAAGTSEDAELVASLLQSADRALDDDHLMYPAKDSALTLYERVLVLDPDNQAARTGVGQIVEKFLQQAQQAAQARDFDEAESFLAKARLVDSKHPAIKPTALQIRLLREARRQHLTLDGTLLRQRDATLATSLADFGGGAKDPDCHVVISAGNDADGRWIYQQLAAAPGDRRLRAQIEISWPPTVELRCIRNIL